MKIKNIRKEIALILATIIVFMMFGFNTNVFAEGETVAKIGDTEYATVKEAFDASQNGDTITLTADAHVTERINVQSKVTLNLNGKVLTLDCNGTSAGKARKIFNYGELTIKGPGTMTNQLGAYGMVDNFGILNIESGTFIDVGGGDGSSFRTYNGATNAKINITGGSFQVEEHQTGNGIVFINSHGEGNITGGEFYSKSSRVYDIINNGGYLHIANVNVYGQHGAIGTNSGETVIDSGSFTAGNYYGCWVTNNGNTNVTINGGSFAGAYGLYASVDDGLQDEGDAAILINGGEFNGTKKAAVALNSAHTEQEWSLLLRGGVYSTDISRYVDTDNGYDSYKIGDKYYVFSRNSEYLYDTFFKLKVGETKTIDIRIKNSILKDILEYEIMDNETAQNCPEGENYRDVLNNKAITVNNGVVTAVEPGVALVSMKLKNSNGDVTKEFITAISVYDITPNNNQSEVDKVASDELLEIINDINESENDDEYTAVLEKAGITEEQMDAIKEATLQGAEITTEVVAESLEEPDVADVELVEEKVEEGQKLAGYYDISVLIKINGEEVAKLKELGKKIKVQLEVPKDLPKVADGLTRTYSVIRVHDGKAEVIEEGLVAQDGKIPVETDKFSTYAVTYTDKVSTNPKTGDTVAFVAIGMIVAMAAVVVIRKIRN